MNGKTGLREAIRTGVEGIVSAFSLEKHRRSLNYKQAEVCRRNSASGRLHLYEDPFNCDLARELLRLDNIHIALDGATRRICRIDFGGRVSISGKRQRPDLKVESTLNGKSLAAIETKVLPWISRKRTAGAVLKDIGKLSDGEGGRKYFWALLSFFPDRREREVEFTSNTITDAILNHGWIARDANVIERRDIGLWSGLYELEAPPNQPPQPTAASQPA